MGDENTSRAWLGREVGKLWASVYEGLQAVVAEAGMWLAGVSWAANRHTEALKYVNDDRHERPRV